MDYIIPVIWPKNPIRIPYLGITTFTLGHAGAIVVDGSTGDARYADFGRYGSNVGDIRYKELTKIEVPSGGIPEGGFSEQELTGLLSQIEDRGTGYIVGATLESADGNFERADLFWRRGDENSQEVFGEYDWSDGHHCYGFVQATAALMGADLDAIDGWYTAPNIAAENFIANSGGFVYWSGDIEAINDLPCFSAETPIQLADGSARAIEDIKLGDTVAAFDERADFGRGALRGGRVTQLLPGVTDEWIVLEDGTRVTPNHPYLMEDGSWLAASDAVNSELRAVAGDSTLITLSGTLLRAQDYVCGDAHGSAHTPAGKTFEASAFAGPAPEWITPEAFASGGVMVQHALAA